MDWITISEKSGYFFINVNGIPRILILIIFESKASLIHCKTDCDAKLILSNKSGWTYLNAFKKWDFWD